MSHDRWIEIVSIYLLPFQNFSPQMSGGYDDKSIPISMPGPMVGNIHTHTHLTAIRCDAVSDQASLRMTGPHGTPWTSWTSWFKRKNKSYSFLLHSVSEL